MYAIETCTNKGTCTQWSSRHAHIVCSTSKPEQRHAHLADNRIHLGQVQILGGAVDELKPQHRITQHGTAQEVGSAAQHSSGDEEATREV